MSDEKNTDRVDDLDLNDLLDSALEDLDKPQKSQEKQTTDEVGKEDGSPSTSSRKSKEKTVEGEWSQEFINQTAEQFEKNFQNLMQNGGDFPSFQKMAQTVANALSDDGERADFQSAISQALKDLSETSENLQNSTLPTNEEELAAMFSQTALDETTGDFLPMMKGMMRSLLSKELLYPPLKEMVEKYPTWLDEQKSTLSTTDLERYNKQLTLMRRVCVEFEKEKDDDSDVTKEQRFEKTLMLMQEMQSCGQPPEDLIGEQPPLFQTDSEGNPIIPPFSPGFGSPQNCSVM